MEFQILHKQGKSLRQIAAEKGVAINTVRKYLAQKKPPEYKARAPRVCKLDAHREYLRQRVSAAHPQWLPATVLAREIQAQGYAGGMSQLRSFLRTLKPAGKDDPVIRFETEPGLQMQVDWIEFSRVPRLAAFVATLGFSRKTYIEFVSDERVDTLIDCHIRAFDYFGGVTRTVLYDNMKTVVLDRHYYGTGQHRYHPAFLDFARHYGFEPKLCKPYRAKTKGKVERFNHYLRYSFYVPLKTLLAQSGLSVDVDTANREGWRWLDEIANERVHGTTGDVPNVRWRQEKNALQPLPPPYRGDISAARPVIAKAPQDSARSPLPDLVPPQHALTQYDDLLEVAA